MKNYTEGYHLKFDIECNEKKISQIKDILKSNSNVIFNFIVNNEVEKIHYLF